MFLYVRCAILLLTLFLGLSGVARAQAGADDKAAQTVLHLLDYVSVEYPQFVSNGKVVNADEYAEQVEFAGQIAQLVAAFPPNAKHDEYVQRSERLLTLIQAKHDGGEVAALAQALQRDL